MNSSFGRPFTLDRVVRLIIGVVIIIGLYLLISKLSGAVLPFLIAWLVAYLMYPLVRFFERKCKIKSRVLAITLSVLSVLIALGIVAAIIVPPIISELERASSLVSAFVFKIQQSTLIPEATRQTIIQWVYSLDLHQLMTGKDLSGIVEKVAPQLWKLMSGSLDFLLSFAIVFLVFLYTVFILADYEQISTGFIHLVPEKYREMVRNIFDDLEDGMNRYFRGQLLIAAIVAVILSVGFIIIDLPLGLLLGLLMGLLTLIPYVKLVMLPVLCFFALLEATETGMPFWIVCLEVVAVVGTSQLIEDLVLTPKIMGKAMGMNPAIILLSLSCWGALLGVVGMIIALPVTAILLSYYRRFVIGNESPLTADTIEEIKAKEEIKKG